jgi:predicted transcriptional regulator of viral defense system
MMGNLGAPFADQTTANDGDVYGDRNMFVRPIGAGKYLMHVASHKFFGYQRQVIGDLPVLMAEVEKVLVDSLDQLRYAGGLVEVAKALYTARQRLDIERLVEHANQMRNHSLCSRLGYLLEQSEQSTKGLAASQSPVLLDPSATLPGLTARAGPQGKARNRYDPRWRVRVNVSDKELWAWRKS